MDYAIIRLGGKQYRVREGEYLVVDRVKFDEGKTFTPDVLLGDSGVKVTATVLAHERGPKIRIGKYQQPHRLQAPQRLPRRDVAHRDLARRRAKRAAGEAGGRGRGRPSRVEDRGRSAAEETTSRACPRATRR